MHGMNINELSSHFFIQLHAFPNTVSDGI